MIQVASRPAGSDDPNMLAVHTRMSKLEKALSDATDMQRRHEHWWKSTQASLEQIQVRIAQEQQARESVRTALRDQFTKEKDSRDSQQATLIEKVDYLEILLNQTGQNHAKGLEAVRQSHLKLEGEVETRDGRHATTVQLITELEAALRDATAKQDKDVESTLEKLEQAHERITEEEKARDAHHENFCAHHASVAERFALVEKLISDSSTDHQHRLEKAHLKVERLHEKLEGEQRAREAHHLSFREQLANEVNVRDALHTTSKERVDYLEQLLGDSVDKRFSQSTSSEADRVSILERFRRLEHTVAEAAQRVSP